MNGVVRFLIGLVLITGGSGSAIANGPAFLQLESVQRLQEFVGEYQVAVEIYDPGTKRFRQPITSQTSVKSHMKGIYLAESGHYGVRYAAIRSYDQFQKRYRFVFVDDYTGLLDVYQGTYQNGEYLLTNLESGTFFKIGEQTYAARMIFRDFQQDGFQMIYDLSSDGGATWLPYARMHYRRETSQ